MSRPALATPRGVLLDVDGTLLVDGRLVDGARDAVAAIRRAGLAVRFATNTTRQPRRVVVDRLCGVGLVVAAADVMTAPRAAGRWLERAGVERVALHVADPTLEEFVAFTRDERAPEAVIVGDLGDGWTVERLNRAFRQLETGARFVALQKNRYWRVDGVLTLDAGPFVAALEYATGRAATVVGKPSRAFFDAAAEAMGLASAQVVVVGDDLESDVRGAIAAGARGVAVRTGKFRDTDLESAGVSPDAVIDSIAELPRLLGLGPGASTPSSAAPHP